MMGPSRCGQTFDRNLLRCTQNNIALVLSDRVHHLVCWCCAFFQILALELVFASRHALIFHYWYFLSKRRCAPLSQPYCGGKQALILQTISSLFSFNVLSTSLFSLIHFSMSSLYFYCLFITRFNFFSFLSSNLFISELIIINRSLTLLKSEVYDVVVDIHAQITHLVFVVQSVSIALSFVFRQPLTYAHIFRLQFWYH